MVLGKATVTGETVIVGVPGAFVLEPPPHPVRKERTETNATAKEQLRSMGDPDPVREMKPQLYGAVGGKEIV
jgi:hypothetical protein